MIGYNFKLEKVLNFKETMENIKKTEHGNVNRRLNEEEEILFNYHLCKEKLLTEKNQSNNNTSIAQLKLYNTYLHDISTNIENQELIIIEIKKELEKTKEELLVAMQEKKSFEKLKENGYNEFIFETKKKEERLVDGIISFNISTQQ